MNRFLNIRTIYDNLSERNLDKLSSVYGNRGRLDEIINEIINNAPQKVAVENKKVLLKPNWVSHSLKAEDELCLRTNDNFVLAVLRAVLRMGPSEVIVGDAPIQGCRWERMITGSFMEGVRTLSAEFNVPVTIRDFRRRTYVFAENRAISEVRPLSEYVIFDLGVNSYLEPITPGKETGFRVTNYDPDRMSEAHSRGIHKYCITKEMFEADIIISLPKIKTHQKAGITGALKNIVGINGDKDYLPHHRLGGVKRGGDCYPGGSRLRYWSELALDSANRRQGKHSFWLWQKLSSLFWILSFPGPEHSLAAGWYGNDTTWRMVKDLNTIAAYGTADGKLDSQPRRDIFSLCDAIIAGQGDGPLEPSPLPLGVISFTNDSIVNDRAMSVLLGIPFEKIPLLNNNSRGSEITCGITLNDEAIGLDALWQYSLNACPPKGWKSYLKNIRCE